MAYVPHFRLAVARTAGWVRSGGAEPSPFAGLSPEAAHRQLLDRISSLEDDYRQFHPFTHWGPATDSVVTFMFRDGGHLLITFEFWRERHLREHPEHPGRVLVAELPAEELAAILDQLVTVLGQDQPRS
jgi:hypothetical protein